MAKEFIREGSVVAFPQKNYPQFWTVLVDDANPENSIDVYVGNGPNGIPALDAEDSIVASLIKVLKAIKKEAGK